MYITLNTYMYDGFKHYLIDVNLIMDNSIYFSLSQIRLFT